MAILIADIALFEVPVPTSKLGGIDSGVMTSARRSIYYLISGYRIYFSDLINERENLSSTFFCYYLFPRY